MFLLLLLAVSVVTLAFAQEEPMMPPAPPDMPVEMAPPVPVGLPSEAVPAPQVEQVTIMGTIVDNMCGSTNKATLEEFIKTHTKECALMSDCAASGYSIYADDKLMAFDKESSAKIEEFLKNPASKLQVIVEANKQGEELSLISIKNQE